MKVAIRYGRHGLVIELPDRLDVQVIRKPAVPVLADAGDICVVNRQCVHGSFPNTSAERRITLNAGFFPRARVEGVTTERLDGSTDTYEAERINTRAGIIALAIDARAQRHPDERRFNYVPLEGREADYRWSESARDTILRDYDVGDMYL